MKKILLAAITALTLGSCTSAQTTPAATQTAPTSVASAQPDYPETCYTFNVESGRIVSKTSERNYAHSPKCPHRFKFDSVGRDLSDAEFLALMQPVVDAASQQQRETDATAQSATTTPAAATPGTHPMVETTNLDSSRNYNSTGTPAYTPFTANDPDPSLLTEHSGTHSEAEANAWQAYRVNHNGMSPMEVQAAYYTAHPECKCATPAQQAANPQKGWQD